MEESDTYIDDTTSELNLDESILDELEDEEE